MVRQPRIVTDKDWDDAPTPILIVEVLSGSTRRRDHLQKRELYLDAGVAEYWIVDPEARNVRVVRAGHKDVVVTEELRWNASGATAPCVVDLFELFGPARVRS
jgi:Uma2 family endonuclease